MGIGPLVNLAGSYIESLLAGSSNSSSPSAATAATTSASGVTQNANQLSPFGQILGSLQQLQTVTQQIAGDLQTGAQSANAAGYTALAGQLTQLSTDFANASTNGPLPNL